MSMLDQAPASAAAGKGELLPNVGSMLWRLVTRTLKIRRSRRLVMEMRDFNDAQLADIGLTRRDLDNALTLPSGEDPSHFLVRARQNPLRGTRGL
jgi:uncharacterized protein YjiS (DUF1127 family)